MHFKAYFSLSPSHFDTRSEDDTEKKVELPASVATAFAKYDFPVPGGCTETLHVLSAASAHYESSHWEITRRLSWPLCQFILTTACVRAVSHWREYSPPASRRDYSRTRKRVLTASLLFTLTRVNSNGGTLFTCLSKHLRKLRFSGLFNLPCTSCT